MNHAQLLNSLRRGDEAILRRYETNPVLLNSLLRIAHNPMPYKREYASTLLNSNGSIDMSSLGYQYTIQTTTLIAADVIAQKFYEEPVAEFAPVLVGRAAFMEEIKINLTVDDAGPFESGIVGVSARSAIPNVSVAMSPITTKIASWNKGYTYSIMEIQKALASNNWDLVSSEYKALTKNWQLGIQAVGFIGLRGALSDFPGLLSNSEVTTNTTFITGPIKDMSPDDFATFVAGIVGLYLQNCNDVRFPNRFVLPRTDFVGLATPVSPSYPTVSKLKYLKKAFKAVCGDDFEILCTAYGDKLRNAGYWAAGGTNRYALYNADQETVHMDLPVDLTLNAPATGNNFHFNGVGFGQFTGMKVYRVPEFLYLDDASSI